MLSLGGLLRLEGDLAIRMVCWMQFIGLRRVNEIMGLNGRSLGSLRNRPKLLCGKIRDSGFAQ